jgi:serine/threonine-protein kinase RsbW
VDDLAQLVLRSLADDVDFRLGTDDAALTFSWPIAGAASSGSQSGR